MSGGGGAADRGSEGRGMGVGRESVGGAILSDT